MHQTAAVLTSWKEIARYMGKGVRTVQRWEQEFNLPVRRAQGLGKKAVLARPRDLDAWVAARCGSRLTETHLPDKRAELERAWSQLQQQIERAQQLCEQNRARRSELEIAIRRLQKQITQMSACSRKGWASGPRPEAPPQRPIEFAYQANGFMDDSVNGERTSFDGIVREIGFPTAENHTLADAG